MDVCELNVWVASKQKSMLSLRCTEQQTSEIDFNFRFRVTKTDPRPARERRSLLITEPNGSVPTTPIKTEAASLNSITDTQPKVSSTKNTL